MPYANISYKISKQFSKFLHLSSPRVKEKTLFGYCLPTTQNTMSHLKYVEIFGAFYGIIPTFNKLFRLPYHYYFHR